MASADYRLCDVCGKSLFMTLNWAMKMAQQKKGNLTGSQETNSTKTRPSTKGMDCVSVFLVTGL